MKRTTRALFLTLLLWVSTVAAQDAADRFYDPEAVQTIRLEIKPEDLNRLQRALP